VNTQNSTRLLTVQDAAHLLAVSVSTLYGWVWQRRIPYIKVGRALRFDLADLERFIEANRIQARFHAGNLQTNKPRLA
jgi:excisionase family DNA binding protein